MVLLSWNAGADDHAAATAEQRHVEQRDCSNESRRHRTSMDWNGTSKPETLDFPMEFPIIMELSGSNFPNKTNPLRELRAAELFFRAQGWWTVSYRIGSWISPWTLAKNYWSYSYGGFLSHRGTPIYGWFISWKIHYIKWMILGTPISGNLHLLFVSFIVSYNDLTLQRHNGNYFWDWGPHLQIALSQVCELLQHCRPFFGPPRSILNLPSWWFLDL